MTSHERVVLGERYRDTISGFTGTATARSEYLHGTPEVLLVAETGRQADAKERWIKEARLSAVVARESGKRSS